MAEFKLGRIRFIWKGTWLTSTEYFIDDVVRYGGRTYICVVGNTSGIFQTDLEASKWNLMSDGQEWKGDWLVNTTYKPNDIVKYGGYLYICNIGHTSAETITLGLEADLSYDSTITKWDLFSEGFDYKSTWGTSTRYKINDLVKYGASIYLCTEEHTSAATLTLGLENDSDKWEIFSKGFNWLNTWTVSTRYKLGDVVRYGGQLYVCNLGHTSNSSATTLGGGLEADQSKWDYLHKGVEYKTDWAVSTRYKINDVVKSGGSLWICTTFHVSTTTLAADEANWAIFIPGLEFEDSWSSVTNYNVGDFVTYGGYSYVASTNNTNKNPFTYSGVDWQLFITGFNLRGDYNGATAYKTGDVVRVGGFTYIAVADTTGNRPPNLTYWNKLNEGIYWKGAWTNATYYDKGDVVRGIINTTDSYICIQQHTSNNTGPTEINKPDAAPGPYVNPGPYWQLLSGGAENNALTTQGDLLIYGPSGPVRLPIGDPGQVLAVNTAGTLPEWKYFGKIDNIWYVSTSGVDEPAPGYGQTLDKPWRSVRYANQQVERGALYPNARNLLLRNKAFIQREIVAWLNATYTVTCTNTTTGTDLITCSSNTVLRSGMAVRFTGTTFGNINTGQTYYVLAAGLTATKFKVSTSVGGTAVPLNTASGTMTVALYYNTTSTQRDMGQVTDAILWDLGHGGNERTRLAALEYLTSSSPVLGGGAGVSVESVAALNRSLVIIDSVISNDVGYTPSQGVVLQVVDATVLEESTAQTQIENLMQIVTDAITAGVDDDVPSEIIASNTVLVKTGMYEEVLPIRVRKNTAIVGDELRSTNIRPAGITTPAGTTGYCLTGLQRMYNIIDDIVLNTTVTPTPGGGVLTVSGYGLTALTGGVFTGSYTNISITGGAGSSATFNVIVDASNFITSVLVNTTGSGYVVGNTLTFPGNSFGAGSSAKTFTVASVSAGNTQSQNQAGPAGSAPAASAAASIATDIYSYINYRINAAGSLPATSGSNTPETAIGYTDAVLRINANIEFIVAEVVAWIQKTWPNYNFTTALQDHCKSDNRELLQGIMEDLIYTGNYKSLIAAECYVNSVLGSETQNMFLLRNATGLRNCTLQGLAGTLGALNAYGTRRPSAGAYASLDPGWGPNHEEVWISSRSPYVQNVSTFGNGCIGLKVDGNLHNGGNDSIVANDFTHLISDGIGAWVTNLGRAELVSIFSYYCHIGYLAENGGKIRATNGNNSYGLYGSVSEGMDVTETPITATVDNQSTDATVANVFTDGSRILALEYSNAGVNYSNATIDIIGDGFGDILTPVYKNGALEEVRLLETVTSPESNFGGDGYVQSSNVAQSGTPTQIVISNTDSNNSAALIGMAVYVTEGLGAGQYGYIVSFNAGSKLAKVAKDSFDTLTVTAATAATDLFTVASTKTLYVNQPIMFSGTAVGGVNVSATNVTIYYIKTIPNSTQFTISTAQGGATFDVASNDTGSMTLHAAGWDHLTPRVCTVTEASDLITTDNTSGLAANMAVIFTGTTFGGIQNNTVYYVISSGFTTTKFKVSASLSGPAVDLSAATGSMTVVPCESVLDGTTKYSVEPRLIMSAPSTRTATAVSFAPATSATYTKALSSSRTDFLITTSSYDAFSPALSVGDGVYVNTVNTLSSVAVTGAAGQFSCTSTLLYKGMSVTASGTLANTNTLTGVSITGTAGQFSCSAASFTLAVGQYITLSGTAPAGGAQGSITGYTNPTTYKISATNGSTTFTLQTVANAPIVTAVGTPTTLTYNVSSIAAYTSPTTYYIIATNGSTTFTLSTSAGGSAVVTAAGTPTGLTFVVDSFINQDTKISSITRNYITLSTISYTRIILSAGPDLDSTAAVVNGDNNITVTFAGVRARTRAVVTTNKISSVRILEPGSSYSSVPTMTIVDPSNSVDAPYETFIGNGVLGQPTWTNRGSSYVTASCLITEDGSQKTVSGVTKASPAVVTTTSAHGYADATKVTFTGLAGMNELNTGIWYYTKSTGANTFELYVNAALTTPLDTTNFQTFNLGGTPRVTSFGGYRDSKQNGKFIKVEGLSEIPQAGANVQFSHLPTTYYKLVSVQSLLGTQYPYSALLQLSPEVSVSDAAAHGTAVTIKIRYSQVRLTGHDFLDIGTGGKATTNYPGLPSQEPDSDNETVESGGGRVFFTSTDQDGNFRVGDLFSVEQATGIATLNADAFNISGLQELQLGDLTLGGTSASINEFSTDGTMSANSDSIVPTQRAIRTYIASQIGGGASSLNVNLLTAGLIQISGNTITTTTGVGITISAVVNFTGGISGAPVAMSYFVQS